MKTFSIEDDFHAEHIEEFPSFELALNRLKEMSKIPWGEDVNRAPCTNNTECKRDYIIKEITRPRLLGKYKIKETKIFSISKEGMNWTYNEAK